MSLLLALALAATAASERADAAPETDIVVIARRLNDWRGVGHLRRGTLRCETKQSTGDSAIDAIGCGAMVQCLTPHIAAMQALEKSREPRAVRQQRGDALFQSIAPCVFEARKQGIAALAERRASQ